MTQPDPPDDLLLFAPVPSAYRGANGWTAEVQRAFVAALERTGVVAAAARSVGRSARSAYQLHARAGADSPFARAWAEAQGRAHERVTDAALGLGTEPRMKEVWYRGRHVGWRTVWENRLAFAALRAADRRDEHLAFGAGDAALLLARATELLDGREMWEVSGEDAPF